VISHSGIGNRRTEGVVFGRLQMRIALAKLLSEKAEPGVLDEPKNQSPRHGSAQKLAGAVSHQHPFGVLCDARPLFFGCHRRYKIVEIWDRGVHFLPRQLREISAQGNRSAADATGRRLPQPSGETRLSSSKHSLIAFATGTKG